jgi:hypothetical protein
LKFDFYNFPSLDLRSRPTPEQMGINIGKLATQKKNLNRQIDPQHQDHNVANDAIGSKLPPNANNAATD